MSETIIDLRSHLFETLKALRDKDNPMPIDRAKAIAEVAQTLINSAKVEVDMINAVGDRVCRPTGFITSQTPAKPALEHQREDTASAGTPTVPTGPRARL